MKTSVNSDTWIKVGSRIPRTANDEPLLYIRTDRPIAAMNRKVPSPALLVPASIAQTTNAAHITKPNQLALSIRTAPTATATSTRATARWGRKNLRSCNQEISVK